MLAHPGSFSCAELLPGLAFTSVLCEVGLQRYPVGYLVAPPAACGIPPGPLRGQASEFLGTPALNEPA